MTVVCGVCRAAMGAVAPLDAHRTIDGLCEACFERGRRAGLAVLARVSFSTLDQVIEHADAPLLAYLTHQLQHRRAAVLARLGPHALAGPASPRARP